MLKAPRSRHFTALARGSGFAMLWLLLMPSLKPADLVFGAVTVVAATALSLRIFDARSGQLHLAGFIALMPFFLWQSIVAGFDVARRALTPRMPLKLGFIAFPLVLPEGVARNSLATFTSLMPGTLPCGEENGALIYHCLDTTQPIVDDLSAVAKKFASVITTGRIDG